jgi:hypothetical protein
MLRHVRILRSRRLVTVADVASFAEIVDQTTADELRQRGSLKWTRGGPGVLGTFVAEMDFGAAPAV